MRNKIFYAAMLFLTACSSSSHLPPTASAVDECEQGVSRPLSVKAKKRGEVYVERTVGDGCSIRDRLVWGKSSITLNDPEWRAGALSIWKGQVALDMHKYFEGHPVECRTRLYKFSKAKLVFVRASRTCGP